MLKTLEMLIILGVGATNLLTFLLWESKKVLKIGDVLFGSKRCLNGW